MAEALEDIDLRDLVAGGHAAKTVVNENPLAETEEEELSDAVITVFPPEHKILGRILNKPNGDPSVAYRLLQIMLLASALWFVLYGYKGDVRQWQLHVVTNL